ncbi:MAG: metallophosphoesterase [Tissierellia bacterium]|nr:metallophosphoesterase [Tissierellia bacterium]
MRIFVISDTHGRTDRIISKIKQMEEPDLIIHLGDYVEDGLKIEEETYVETIIVKGNGDYFHTEFNEDELLTINNKKVFISHGHNYNVQYGEDNIIYKALELGADLILFGHTHVPRLFEEAGILVMNPGSPTFPRGFRGSKTFGIIEIDEEISGEIIEIE